MLLVIFISDARNDYIYWIVFLLILSVCCGTSMVFFLAVCFSLCKPWLKGTENKLVTRTQMLVSAPPCLTQWQYPHILNPLLMPGQDTQCRHRRLWEGEEAVKVQPSTTDILTFRETTHNQSTCNFPQTPVPKSWPKPHSGEGATATDEFCSWLCDA